MGPKNPYKSFDRKFKNEAVRLILDEARSVASVARDLDIHENILHLWKRQYLEEKNNALLNAKNSDLTEEELHRLKKENANLREEREILKKALAIFSKHPK